MGAGPAGFTPNVARQVAQVNQKANPDRNTQAQTNQGPRAAASSPAAGARTAPTQAQNIPIAMHPGAMAAMMGRSGIASQAVTASGVGETKDENKKEINKAVNRGKEIAEKSSLALKDSNSQTGSEAGEISGANSANAPAA